jgi:hypothetical protein
MLRAAGSSKGDLRSRSTPYPHPPSQSQTGISTTNKSIPHPMRPHLHALFAKDSKLKQLLENNVHIEFDAKYEKEAQYRPFTKEWLYFDPKVIHRAGADCWLLPSWRENRQCHHGHHRPFAKFRFHCKSWIGRFASMSVEGRPKFSLSTPTLKSAPTAARTSPTGLSNSSAPITPTSPSTSGTSSTTSTPSCTTPSTASATPPISAATSRIPLATSASSISTLPSRAERERPEDGHTESRDPMPADTQQRPEKEFSLRTSSGGVRGTNSSLRWLAAQSDTGSFDSAKEFARESHHSARMTRVEGEARCGPLPRAGDRPASV